MRDRSGEAGPGAGRGSRISRSKNNMDSADGRRRDRSFLDRRSLVLRRRASGEGTWVHDRSNTSLGTDRFRTGLPARKIQPWMMENVPNVVVKKLHKAEVIRKRILKKVGASEEKERRRRIRKLALSTNAFVGSFRSPRTKSFSPKLPSSRSFNIPSPLTSLRASTWILTLLHLPAAAWRQNP